MTLLSVVQALVLEAPWAAARENTTLYLGGAAAWIGWLQVAAVFQGIVVIWLFYIGIVMRFTWVPDPVLLASLGRGAGVLALSGL